VCLDLDLVKGDLMGDGGKCVLVDNVDEFNLADDFDEHKQAGLAKHVMLLAVIAWRSRSSEGVEGCIRAWGDRYEDLAFICGVEWCKVLGATGGDDCGEALAIVGGDDECKALAVARAEDIEGHNTLASEDV
jgi:hypothetical protein